MELLYLLLGLAIGGGLGFLLARQWGAPSSSAQVGLQTLREERASLQARLETLQQQLETHQKSIDRWQRDYQAERDARQTLEAEKQALHERIEARKQELETLQKRQEELLAQTQSQIENKVHDLFQKNSAHFQKDSQERLGQMLDPLREQLRHFRQQTQDQHEARLKENEALVGKIGQLTALNQEVQESAAQLTRALRSDSRQQGAYGEMMLEQLFEAVDLQSGIHYEMQASFQSTAEDGSSQRQRPDCLVYLPKGPSGAPRYAIIDSKVALTQYVAYVNAETPEAAQAALRAHTQAIQNHIQGLAGKRYHQLEGSALEFTMLFVPNEGAMLAALKQRHDLFTEAAARRIVLVSPSTLLAMLRMIRSLWQQDDIQRNARDIADRAGKLYDKFVLMYQSLEAVGEHLQKSQDSYRQAMGQLRDGRGNLVGQVEKLRKLGARHEKDLPASARQGLEEQENLNQGRE